MLAGFSINILTLLALVLATGLVVDDAIVVIENISRQRALGLGPRAAAVLGTRQVFFAVLSTTVTLAAVFIPISFFPGTAGRLFSEFGFVLAFSVTLSAFVALTLVPMLASRWIGSGHHAPSRNPIGRAVSGFGVALERLYARLLDGEPQARRSSSITGALLFAGAAAIAYPLLPNQLTPVEDRGFVPISIRAPQGATVDYTAEQVQRAEAIVQEFRDRGEIVNVFATARGLRRRRLHVRDARAVGRADAHQQEITADLNRRLQEIPASRCTRHRQQPRHPRRWPGPAVRRDRAGLRPDRGRRDRAHARRCRTIRPTTPSASTTTPPSRSSRSGSTATRAADVGVPVQNDLGRDRRPCSRAATSAPSPSATSASRSAPWRRRG